MTVKKQATVKKKYTAKKKVVAKPVAPTKNKYKNISNHNLFTEGGRCMPDETVELTADEAATYPALEILQ